MKIDRFGSARGNRRRRKRRRRRTARRFLAFAAVALLSKACLFPAWAQMNPPPATYRSDRILVKPKGGILTPALSDKHASLQAGVLRTFVRLQNWQVLQLPPSLEVTAAVALYQQSGLVDYAELDYRVQINSQPGSMPNDLRFRDGSLWALHNSGQSGGTPDCDIDAPEAWETRNSASNVVVAVIDTGTRYTHEDLAANMWRNPGEIPGNAVDDDGNGFVDDVHGINAILDTGDPSDDHGHGTHVSGVIGGVGNNDVGIVGVAWQAQLMACKFIHPDGSGFISDAITCIDYARSEGAKIVNASWGSYSFTSVALRDAISSTRDAGMIWVSATGNDANDNDANPLFPASYEYDNIIAVAATTHQDVLAAFSNYGATNVDVGAPGTRIFSCWNRSDSDYLFFDGTSMAAPHVAGVCALLQAHHPDDTYQQIINRVLSNVDPLAGLAGKCVSGGRANLHKALGDLPPPPPSDEPVITLFESEPAASETGPVNGVIRFHRTGDTSQPLQLNWTFSGTAVNGSDFQPLPTSSPFPTGEANAFLTITPIDDAEGEGNETVTVTLVDGPGYSVGVPNISTVTIADNDPTPPPPPPTVTVVATDGTAAEFGPDTGQFTITRQGDTALALTVHYTLGGSAQNGSDYETLTASVTIASGSASATVTVRPLHDIKIEVVEDVVLTLQTNAGYTIGSPNSDKVQIIDDDADPLVVMATDASAGETGPNEGQFTIARVGDIVLHELTVQFTLSGSAVNGTDYQQLPTSVTIPADALSANVRVTPVNDAAVEGDETVVLILSPSDQYEVGLPDRAIIRITDND